MTIADPHTPRAATLRDQLAKTLHEAEDGPACICPPIDRAIHGELADAVLALVDVDEEWGLVWPPTGDIDWVGTETEARGVVAAQPHEVPALRDLGRLRRRWVLTTKPEKVTP